MLKSRLLILMLMLPLILPLVAPTPIITQSELEGYKDVIMIKYFFQGYHDDVEGDITFYNVTFFFMIDRLAPEGVVWTNTSKISYRDFSTGWWIHIPIIGLGGKCNENFTDIRITDENFNILPQYIEKINETHALAYFLLSSLQSNTEFKIYIWYNNQNATKYEGELPFIIYDDFEDQDVSDWNVSASTSLTFTTSFDGGVALKIQTTVASTRGSKFIYKYDDRQPYKYYIIVFEEYLNVGPSNYGASGTMFAGGELVNTKGIPDDNQWEIYVDPLGFRYGTVGDASSSEDWKFYRYLLMYDDTSTYSENIGFTRTMVLKTSAIKVVNELATFGSIRKIGYFWTSGLSVKGYGIVDKVRIYYIPISSPEMTEYQHFDAGNLLKPVSGFNFTTKEWNIPQWSVILLSIVPLFLFGAYGIAITIVLLTLMAILDILPIWVPIAIIVAIALFTYLRR